ncbi:TIGR03936 family radical SAM-associated protein [Lachnospiraceae bacterium ZAX-1]
MNIRIKFQKYGNMRFIGHLDMMRYFQKCMRRAKIDIAYSAGYSPHQIMSFAAPLGVGITSDGEYLDIEVNTLMDSTKAIKDLNEVMVDGVRILEYKQLPDNAKNAMSLVAGADYTIYFKEGYENPFSFSELADSLNSFYNDQAEIIITKKTKKSEKMIDLKGLIYQLNAIDLSQDNTLKYSTLNLNTLTHHKLNADTLGINTLNHSILNHDIRVFSEETPAFFLKVCAGSTDNVKPELVLEAFFTFCNKAYDPLALQIHRNEVYGLDANEKLIPLGEFGHDTPTRNDSMKTGEDN